MSEGWWTGGRGRGCGERGVGRVGLGQVGTGAVVQWCSGGTSQARVPRSWKVERAGVGRVSLQVGVGRAGANYGPRASDGVQW